ncbi:PREDICTED: uncharacterized protein LOC105973391 [Erythranthe guttata]|uniref:uncharacterized protein LOC105973391 n=1 Tax=Erythranthe guttata TaxID=4155 RepID=UPI00064DEE0D|nr:PREDICTED: uncharacterized protein LOC105973391 [Erythranthe guttata]|eukprot:XP_012853866.1 PREDICTED: uncharacterized protein LOC105973391 [Erythranthe guttata]
MGRRESKTMVKRLLIPEDMLIPDSKDPLLELLQFVYPDLLSNISNPDYFQGRAVLVPTNDCVEFVNEYLCSLLPGEEKLYLSADSMCNDEMSSEENAQIYTTEFLNTVSCSGLPSHRLKLKENVPVMLIRNIDQARGLCNGTRLQVVRMGTHVLSCKVLSGKNTSDVVFIPRMTLVPSNSTLPIKFQRRQFPLMISFAMTINKSQGQTLSHVGLYLPRPVFSHGQLYVALSRVKSRSGIKILIKSESGGLSSSTSNIVYKERLSTYRSPWVSIETMNDSNLQAEPSQASFESLLREVDVSSIPMYPFKFTSYADIQQALNNNDYAIGPLAHLAGGTKQNIPFELEDIE